MCLLALAPASPLGLALTSHDADAPLHGAVAVVHDEADHGIAPEPLPDTAGDAHCLYCQTATSLRLGWGHVRVTVFDPSSRRLEWADAPAVAPGVWLRHSLPARAPPRD